MNLTQIKKTITCFEVFEDCNSLCGWQRIIRAAEHWFKSAYENFWNSFNTLTINKDSYIKNNNIRSIKQYDHPIYCWEQFIFLTVMIATSDYHLNEMNTFWRNVGQYKLISFEFVIHAQTKCSNESPKFNLRAYLLKKWAFTIRCRWTRIFWSHSDSLKGKHIVQHTKVPSW